MFCSNTLSLAIISEPTVSEAVPGAALISCDVSEEGTRFMLISCDISDNGSGTALKSSDARAFLAVG